RIDSAEGRWVDLMSGHRDADAVREFDDTLLLTVWKADVAFQQVVLKHLRSLQLDLEMRGARDRDAHLVVHALILEQVAGGEHAWTDSFVRVDRFARLHRFIWRTA